MGATENLEAILGRRPQNKQQPTCSHLGRLYNAAVSILGRYIPRQGLAKRSLSTDSGRYANLPGRTPCPERSRYGQWLAATKRVRQQSIRYRGGYIQDFDLHVFEHLKVVDFGDADIPPETSNDGSVEKILEAQEATMRKVKAALAVGAVPIVIGQNSPCGSYAIGRPIAESVSGPVGMVSLDTHWDVWPYDWATMSPYVPDSTNWKDKLYRDCPNMLIKNLVEIGKRGMLEDPSVVRRFLREVPVSYRCGRSVPNSALKVDIDDQVGLWIHDAGLV
nr:arginase family protein [Mesorhizobium loti]